MLDFFKKLLPNFEKRKLVGLCDNSLQYYSQILIPTIDNYNEYFISNGSKATSSPLGKRLQKDLERALSGTKLSREYRGHLGLLVKGVSTAILTKLNHLRKYVLEEFGNNVATNGISFQDLHVLRMLDLITFFFKYSNLAIHQVVQDECDAASVPLPKSLTPAEQMWLNDNFNTYIRLATLMAEDESTFESVIKSTSELIVAETNDIGGQLNNTDPHKLGFIPIVGDLILLLGNAYVTIEHDMYERDKLHQQSVMLRLNLLKESLNGQEPTPEQLKTIQYMEERIKKLSYKIKQYEEKVGV
nr:MAG TPA: hypothetical protein [Caudoviricetes sp.]